MTRGSGRLTLPVVLIAIGVIFLLINTGIISTAALQRLGDLWPLLLVILGLQLIFAHLLPHRQARLAGLGAAIIISIAAVGYAILSPAPDVNQPQEAAVTVPTVVSPPLIRTG